MTFRFEGFTLDAAARQLHRGGTDVHLSPKAFDLLLLLLERRPAVVDKAELRRHLWPEVHVVDASLSNLVTEIRAALGDRRSDPSMLRTVHGVGYAFAGDVQPPPGDAPADDPSRAASCWLVWKDRPIPLPAGEHVVGRDASCAIWIDAGGVSRRHATISVAAAHASGAVTIADLKSTNGTYVGGRRVTEVLRLSHGDRIQLGDATLVFRARAGEAATRRVRRPKGT